MKNRLLVTLTVLLVATSITAVKVQSNAFTSTPSLFTIGKGARPLGLGGAFVGLADDGNALLYNPAGLTQVVTPNLSSFYSNQFGSVNFGSVTLSKRNFGISYLQLSSRGLTERDIYGSKIGEFDFASRGMVGAYANSFGALSLGLQTKVFFPEARENAFGISLSPGMIYEVDPFQVGMIVKNLVSTNSTSDQATKGAWSRKAIGGIAYQGERFKIDLDIRAGLTEKGIESNLAKIGAEVLLFNCVTARAGITSGLSSSIGFSLDMEGVRLNYTFSNHEELAASHRFSVVVNLTGSPRNPV
ncbi:MAG: hypothetical protein ABEJ25_02555 [Candidatus Bipolaricaulia bacterium]